MKRRLLNLVTALSLLLCVAAGALWARSYASFDQLQHQHLDSERRLSGLGATSYRGALALQTTRLDEAFPASGRWVPTRIQYVPLGARPGFWGRSYFTGDYALVGHWDIRLTSADDRCLYVDTYGGGVAFTARVQRDAYPPEEGSGSCARSAPARGGPSSAAGTRSSTLRVGSGTRPSGGASASPPIASRTGPAVITQKP